jgi:hypothetical protein
MAALDAGDDIPPWTDEEAAAWWSLESVRLRSAAPDARPIPTTEATIIRPSTLVTHEPASPEVVLPRH